MKNNKGFTVVELLVSVTLTVVIVLFLIEILLVLKNLYINTGIKTKLLTKQAIITENINNDLLNLNITIVKKCADADICIEFVYEDDSEYKSKKLIFDRDGKYIKYDGIATNLVSGSKFGNINVSYEKIIGVNNNKTKDSILSIEVPIYHNLFERENYGINILYQYNSHETSVSNVYIQDIVDAEKKIYLIGGDDIKFKDIDYIDPGYYVVDNNGNVLSSTDDLASSDPIVKKVGFVGNTPGEKYYITYTIYDMNGNKMSEVVRCIDVVDSNYVFSLTGDVQELRIPVTGTYEIEAWGASGGGTALMRGKGGYTKDTLELTTNDKLYIQVGGAGSYALLGKEAVGGYNGGGNSGISTLYLASSGGGASDVRLNSNDLSARIIVAGGGGGGGSRSDSSFTCNGGAGGGLNGKTGTCSAESYVGGAGSQTSAGVAASFTPAEGVLKTPATSGVDNVGGNGATYVGIDGDDYASGGGGGGYYGGGGGARYGGGGGGSGYCKNETCQTFDGTQTFITVDGNSYEQGHDGDGFVKITLKSVKFN